MKIAKATETKEKKMAEKMTRKELFVRIKNEMSNDPAVVEMCDKYIAALSKPRKPKANPEVGERQAAVASYLADVTEPVTQAMVGEALGIKPGQAGYALRALAEQGIATLVEGKKSDPKAYVLAR